MSHPRYPPDEIVRRGQALYDQEIREKVEPGNPGKILAIDIETGDFELDEDPLAAAERVLTRHPDAALFVMRIGSPTMGRIGSPQSVGRP